MVRSLYRVYLYSVLVVLLYFTAISTAILVGKLFEFTPLNSPNTRAFVGSEVTAPATFAAIAWLMTLLVGGLHYWLLLRDERGDPTAGPGAVRAFMVNFAEGVAALVAVAFALGIYFQVRYGGSVGNSLGPLVVFALLFALFEVERRRTQARAGAAMALQRIHFYILPVFFLAAFVLSPLISTINDTVSSMLLGLGLLTKCTINGYSSPAPNMCVYPGVIPSHLGAAWLAVAVLVAWWAGYAVLTRADTRSNMRPTMRVLGYTVGVVVVVYGITRGLELAARAALGLTVSGYDFVYGYAFAGSLIAGIAVVVVYVLWLRADMARWPDAASGVRLSAHAVTAAVLALVFYSGCYLVLSYVVEHVVPGATRPDRGQLATAVALVVTGLSYIPLAITLRTATTQPGAAIAPRRAFGLALLAIGTLTTVIALVVVLYATVTAALGNPPSDWQHLARSAACALTVGVVLVAIYLRLAFAERWLAAVPHPAQPEEGAPVAPTSGTVEAVLDELLAGHLTREQAAARINALHP